MTEEIQNYLLTFISACFLCAVVQALMPKGAEKKAACFGCGLVLILTVLKPVAALDLEHLARSISRWEIQASEIQSGIKIENQELIAAIIKEKCETYIWDKAAALGIVPQSVEVEILADGSQPHPCSVKITGEYTQGQKQQLSQWIRQELAVGTEDQEWTWSKR